MTGYEEFLAGKRILAEPCGFDVSESQMNPKMFGFQKHATRWDLQRGKAALFEGTGLGKGLQELEYCRLVHEHTGGDMLLLAPLCVAQQFKREAAKFDYSVTVCKEQSDVKPGINITNYDRADNFDLGRFAGIVSDESGIYKDFNSKTTKKMIARQAQTRFKLCASATPSPNDYIELGTHAELLDVMTRTSMLATFFEHDGGQTSKWKLKGHGKKEFFRWLSSYAICMGLPSDLGFPDDDFILKPLNIHEHVVPVDQSIATEGMLFRCPDLSATGLHKELRLTAADRAKRVAEIVAGVPTEPWLIWVNTNYESDEITKLIPEAVEVRGSDDPDTKEDRVRAFCEGNIRVMVSKPSITGHGINMQHCCHMAFIGILYSFEQVYQAIRRCWRYGQVNQVEAHMVMAETEGPIMDVFRRKQRQHNELRAEMISAMRENQLKLRPKEVYNPTLPMEVPPWLITQSA